MKLKNGMRITTGMDTDIRGGRWPLVQFGPIDNEADAQAMLDAVTALISDHLDGTPRRNARRSSAGTGRA